MATAVVAVIAVVVTAVLLDTPTGASPPDTTPSSSIQTLEAPDTSEPRIEPAETVPASAPPTVPPTTAVPGDIADDGAGDPDEVIETRPAAAPTVRSSEIPVSSIVIAVGVLLAVGVAAALLARRAPARPPVVPSTTTSVPPVAPGASPASAAVTLQFLLELGEALIDAGDAVGHVEAMLRKVAATNGIEHLGVLVLPSVLVLSVQDGEAVTTEVRTGGAGALRLDQIDDVLRLELAAERGEVDPAEGRRQLAAIRAAPRTLRAPIVLIGYVVASMGLAMILRGTWLEVLLAAALGLVIGGLRFATFRQPAAYQAFWPLIAATSASAAVFTAARVFDDLAVFPALIAPLIFFLPGGLLTIGVLELATGNPVSGGSRVAAGGMQLLLLAIGLLAGSRLVGVPGGDIRSGGDGVAAVLQPWFGVVLFGIGVAWFYGARRTTLMWIMVVLAASYAGQVIGGLFFGSSLSAFFGALVMTPVALLAARQKSGPTPLVTFLPGFWLLVPGSLGLEGVTRLIGDDGELGLDVLITTATSMVGISLGVLLGLVVSGADPSRPWSIARRSPAH